MESVIIFCVLSFYEQLLIVIKNKLIILINCRGSVKMASSSPSLKSVSGKPERPPPPRAAQSLPVFPDQRGGGILLDVPPLPPERIR